MSRLPLLLALSFLWVGCDSDSTDLDSGTFQAQITGDVTKSFSGVASFGSVTAQDQAFALSLSSPSGDAIAIARMVPGRPPNGTIVIADVDAGAENNAFWGNVVLLDEGVVLQSVSGMMQITTSTSTTLSGTLTFDATAAGGLTAVVTASFNAVCGVMTGGSCD